MDKPKCWVTVSAVGIILSRGISMAQTASFPQSWILDRKLSDFIKNIFIYVPKMNESLTGLERHECEKFSFLGELSL